jgi:hypothetical protein
VTRDEAARLVDEYRAGLEAEIALLHQIDRASMQQRAGAGSGDFSALDAAADERDRLMQALVTIEATVRLVRAALAEGRQMASEVPGFLEVVAMHRDAVRLVGRILAADEDSLAVLADAELARRSAAASLERGGATLAAYRRVLIPSAASARLVDRRG